MNNNVTTASQEVDPVKQYRDRTGVNKAFYDRIVANKENWKLSRRQVQPIHTGEAYFVPAGSVFTIRQTHGPQINDVMFANAHDLRETSSFETTMQLEGFQMTTLNRAWTNVPYMRPIATIIEDGANYSDKDSLPDDNTKWHFFGPHCTTELIEAASGKSNHPSCQTNFEMAWGKLGVPADDARTRQADLNVFQPNDFSAKSEAGFSVGALHPGKNYEGGQYISFYAEMDSFVLVSMCPFGNQDAPILEVTNWPQTMEIYDSGIAPEENPRHFSHQEEWNLRKNQIEGTPEKPVIVRIPGVTTLEKADTSYNDAI
ncbi:DUF1989 domain-containing protein [Vibrio barjaei]|uniref:DUF1989 domain-containing protein n=1 Tax=Vibrio barjaei TaxID=1676683 RepID=A0ABW7IPQ1_9VIBR